MSTAAQPQLSAFARDVAAGLADPVQKYISARYFYDDLGSALFEAITMLPEYGLTRADRRLLEMHADKIARAAGAVSLVAELGSGSGKKTRKIVTALSKRANMLRYSPIDVSAGALAHCKKELCDVVDVLPVCADWLEGLIEIAQGRADGEALLLLFLGSSIGNLERNCIPEFLRRIRSQLHAGDYFLLGADLVKDIDSMMSAYDDATGVTAAFNLNLLARINRELDGNFDLRSFSHEVRWSHGDRRIEMHLLSSRNQTAYIGALDLTVEFQAGETIWTESSHKFTVGELNDYARMSGFVPAKLWVDDEWPFVEALWKA